MSDPSAGRGGAPATDAGGLADPVVRRPTARRGRAPARGRGALLGGAVAVVVGVALVVAGLVADPRVEAAASQSPELRPATPVLSARRLPAVVLAPVARRNLATATAPVLAAAPTGSCLLLGDAGTDLVSVRVTDALQPASTMKVVTAGAALDVLGPDTRLGTRFVAAAPPAGGTVTGDLWMVGGGDPLLSTGPYAALSSNGERPATDLAATADALVDAGVRRITGSVVGDGGRYDDQRTVAGWPGRFLTQNVVGPLGALMVNDGWTVDPDGDGPGTGTPGVAADPAQHAAEVLTALLVARGVEVVGAPTVGTAPAGAALVFEQPSLTVRELVGELLAFSDNTTAELLVKELGYRDAGTGSTEAGLAVVRRWLEGTGLPLDGVVLADGSGLSSANRLTCRVVAGVLAADGPDGPIAAGLALPGRPGTLDDRFTAGALRERLRAKTGTLNDVTALAGWVTTTSGVPLDFAVIVNAADGSVAAADTALQGRLLESVLAYPQAPAVAEVSPRPPVAG